ncbi:GNAT family N-acetyltransferase [Sphingomonas sp. ASV193]|uniref:GNAT family N-acetyltransferase n=1 Tax=Sphingomonas sp. ASV193 TaxID=3144405 RepID=UPI0032E90BD3
MTVAYRDGRAGDGAALSKLFCESFAATFGHLYADEDIAAFLCQKAPEAFEAQLADPAFAFRLAEEGRLVGYAKLGPNELPFDAPDGTYELHQLYLAEAAKGAGIADTLMAWAKDEARRRGFGHLALSVYIDNHRARRFYDRRGFVEVGAYKFMVGNHEDDDRIMLAAL